MYHRLCSHLKHQKQHKGCAVVEQRLSLNDNPQFLRCPDLPRIAGKNLTEGGFLVAVMLGVIQNSRI